MRQMNKGVKGSNTVKDTDTHRVRIPSVSKAVFPLVGNSLDVQEGHITDTLVRHPFSVYWIYQSPQRKALSVALNYKKSPNMALNYQISPSMAQLETVRSVLTVNS